MVRERQTDRQTERQRQTETDGPEQRLIQTSDFRWLGRDRQTEIERQRQTDGPGTETDSDFRLQMVYCILAIGPYTNRRCKIKLCTQTDSKTYKQQNTQTNKTDTNKQTTDKNNKQKKSRPKQSHRDNETLWWHQSNVCRLIKWSHF